MESAIETPRLFAEAHLKCMHFGALAIRNSCVVLCFFVTTCAHSDPGSEAFAEGHDESQCQDADPRYHCTSLGTLSGSTVVRGELPRCSPKEMPDSPDQRERWGSVFLYQFQIAEQSSLAISAEGLANMILYSGSSVDQSAALEHGVPLELVALSGTYTLACEAPQCTDNHSNEDIEFRLGIELLGDGDLASSVGDGTYEDQTSLQDVGIAVARTVVISTYTALGLVLLTILAAIALLGG